MADQSQICGKPGCGAPLRVGHPCTDADCPQQWVSAEQYRAAVADHLRPDWSLADASEAAARRAMHEIYDGLPKGAVPQRGDVAAAALTGWDLAIAAYRKVDTSTPAACIEAARVLDQAVRQMSLAMASQPMTQQQLPADWREWFKGPFSNALAKIQEALVSPQMQVVSTLPAALPADDDQVRSSAPDALDAVLRPLAAIADEYDEAEDDSHEIWIDLISKRDLQSKITLGTCREARRVLTANRPEPLAVATVIEKAAKIAEDRSSLWMQERTETEYTEGECIALSTECDHIAARIRSLASSSTSVEAYGALATLRENGWMVGVHNDYRLNGEAHTFWLFTHSDGRWVKGEGRTDAEALGQAAAAAREIGSVVSSNEEAMA